MPSSLDYTAMLQIALEEARQGLSEGGIPIGAALFNRQGKLLGRGHNRRVQENDPSVHAETDAFRKAGRQRGYRDTIMVTTLAPCWYCSGLVRQFVSVPWSWGNRSILLVVSIGYVTTGWKSTTCMTQLASSSWQSTLRPTPRSGTRISARSNSRVRSVYGDASQAQTVPGGA